MKSVKYLCIAVATLAPALAFAQNGPGRDDPGDRLRQLNAPRANVGGLAWDEETHLIWGTNRANPCRLWALDPDDGDVVHDYQIDQQGAAGGNGDDAIGLGMDPEQGLLWVNQWNAPGSNSVANLYDRDGNNVRRVQLPRGGHFDFCTDGEWMYAASEYTENDVNAWRIYRFNRNGEEVTEGPNLRAIANHGRALALCYVPAHDGGNFWLMSVGFISRFSVDWENNRGQRISEFQSANNDYPHQGLTHDGFNLWGGGTWGATTIYVYDDGLEEVNGQLGLEQDAVEFGPTVAGDENEQTIVLYNLAEERDEVHRLEFTVTDLGGAPDWLRIPPSEGTIEAGDSAEVTLTAVTEGLRLGQYERDILIETNDPNRRETVIPLHIFVVDGWGTLSGRITDATDGSAVEGAIIATEHFSFADTTDAEGLYVFEEIPAWNYTFHVTCADFLPAVRDVNIQADDDLEENFALLHSEFDPRPATIEETLQTNDTLNSRLTIANPGNGPLAWSSVIDFPDELEQDPWTLRQSYPVSQITGDARIQAVTFAEDKIFLAGAAEQRKLIYSVSRDGELLDTFRQFSASNYGFASLTWDGEILWGAGDRIIYGFSTSGDSITSFAGPHNLSSNVVWDSDREVLWLASATSNIVSCDRAGNVQTTLNRRSMRIYGLGYYPEDPDGFPLYVFTNPTGNVRLVMKMDPDTGDTLRAALLPDDGGRPAGSAVTNLYDPYSWIFFGVSNIAANDVLYAWHLSAKTGWIRTSPQTGVVEAGSTGNVDIHFDAYGLTPELIYGTVLRFSHDGVGGMTEVPVSLSVTDVGGLTQRVIRLDFGWNLISTNLSPEGADDFAGLMSPLVESGQLILAKDGGGHFYWPARQFDGIEGWDGRYGYWLKVGGACELRLSGESLSDETAIPLEAGWNTVAYLPRQPTGAEEGFSGLGGNLVIARDGRGRFYLPAYGFNDLAPLHEGAGYQVRVREAGELIYSRGERGASFSRRYAAADAAWLESLPVTTSQHNILIVSDLPYGTRLEALTTTGVVAGRGVIGSDGLAGLTLWGDDVGKGIVEGFANGEVARVVVPDGIPIPNSKLQIPNFPPFTDGGWDVVELKSSQSPVEFGIVSAYPNPFNSMLNLEFTLQRGDIASVILLDISGREVASYHAGRLAAGNHQLTIQGGNLASGIYVLRLESLGAVSTRKIVLAK